MREKTHPNIINVSEKRDARNAPNPETQQRNDIPEMHQKSATPEIHQKTNPHTRNAPETNHKETREPPRVWKSIIIENTHRRPILTDCFILRYAKKRPTP